MEKGGIRTPAPARMPGDLRRAVNHALTLFLAMTSAIVMWYFSRFPDDSVLLITLAMMTAGAAYDVQSLRDRFHLVFSIVLCAGIFQFLTGILYECKFLILIADAFLTFSFARILKHRRGAGIAIVIGHLAMTAPGGFYPSANRLIETGFSGLAAFSAVLFVPWIHRKNSWAPAWDGGFTRAEALRLACSTLTGCWIYKALTIPEGVWIPATAAFLYMSKKRGGNLFPMAEQRLYGTILGMVAGALYLGCLSWFEYRMMYLVPFIAGLGFFLNYYLNNYLIYSFLFMMSFCLYSDFLAGQSPEHLLQLTTSRIVCTALGVLLTLFFDMFFLPEETAREVRHE